MASLVISTLSTKTREFYKEQFRAVESTSADDPEPVVIPITPPVKQVLVYVEDDDVSIDFNKDVLDEFAFKVPAGGSLSYPFLTGKIVVQGLTSGKTAKVWVRGLR